MKKINYFITTEINWFKALANEMARAFHTTINVNQDSILLSSSIGDGKIVFKEIEEGLGLLKLQVQFKEQIEFYRCNEKVNDYFILHFNLSSSEVLMKGADDIVTDIGTDWNSALFYSTTRTGVSMKIDAKCWNNAVIFIFHKSWIIKNLALVEFDFLKQLINKMVNNLHFQGFVNLTIEQIQVVHELLWKQRTEKWDLLYYKSTILKLFYSFLTKVNSSIDAEQVYFNDVLTIMAYIDTLKNSWPTTIEAARNCNISRSKFIQLFKFIYGKSYYDYYLAIRMEKAATLLVQGNSIAKVAVELGYASGSSFSKQFKEYFKVEPSHYI